MKRFMIAAALLMGFSAQAANVELPLDIQNLQQKVFEVAETNEGILPWKVGDKADYKVNVGGFLEGTMNMFVREEITEGFWIEQNIDMMIQKSKVEILFDKNTGQVLQLIVDGQKQDVPKGGAPEIVESKPDTVTVPAGTFECTYAKVKDKESGDTTELWLEMEIIPIFGLIKQIGQSQFGPVTVELTSFLKH